VDHEFIEDVEDVWYLKRSEVKELLWDLVTAWATGSKPRGPLVWPKEIQWRKGCMEKFRTWTPPDAMGTVPETITEPFTIVLWGITSESMSNWAKLKAVSEGTTVIDQLRKVNIPYNVNLFTEMAALRLLDNEAEMRRQVQYLKDERDRVAAEMQAIAGITIFPSAANFILIQGPDFLFQALKDRGVLVRDVSSYPLLSGHQRVSIGFKEENDLFLNTLKQIMNDYEGNR